MFVNSFHYEFLFLTEKIVLRNEKIIMILFDGFEWACLRSRESGLPFDLWIDSMGSDRKRLVNPPRVLIRVRSGRLVSVRIDKNKPKILSIFLSRQDRKAAAQMLDFIACAYEILLAHWSNHDDYEALGRLIELSKNIPPQKRDALL